MARAKTFQCKGCGKLIFLRRVCDECAEKWPAVKFLRDWIPEVYSVLRWFDSLKKPKPKTDPDSDYVSCDQFLASDRLRDLTPDEREEVRRAFGSLQKQCYLSNYVDNILGASAAATLCNLASGMSREISELESDPELKSDLETAGEAEVAKFRNQTKECKDRIVWLARKATELYPHPILFERLANLLEKMGRSDDANRVREAHNKQKLAWTPKYTDELLMMDLHPEKPYGEERA